MHIRLDDEEDTAVRFVQKQLGLESGQDAVRYAVQVVAKEMAAGRHKKVDELLRTTVR